MKNSVYTMLLVSIICVNNSIAQRKYVDLSGCESINNPKDKIGWGLPVFYDEFDGSMSKVDLFSYSGCGIWDYSDKFTVIRSEHDWRWGWDFYGKHGDPTYEQLDDVIISDTGYISLQMAYHPTGVYIDPLNNNDLRYPVKKYYSASEINTSVLNGCELIPGDGYNIVKPENNFTYGWFEIRAKLPKAKYTFPAFWLFGGTGGSAGYNEIDCFELGGNDKMVHTDHWQNADGSHRFACGSASFAMPGQTFGDRWVTYAVKWEPNKIIWYVNNEPVRIISNIDLFTDDYSTSCVIIPDRPMHIIADNEVNMEYLRYNVMQEFDLPNSLDIDYIRVWQRFPNNAVTDNMAAYVSTPDPVFKINGEYCGGVNSQVVKKFYSGSTMLVLDASESYMPEHKYRIIIMQGAIEKFNDDFQDDGDAPCNIDPDTQHIDISNVNLKQLYPGLMPNIIYKVIVRGGGETPGCTIKEDSQLFMLVNSPSELPSFSINGVSNLASTGWPPVAFSYNYGKSSIILDVSDAYLKYGCDIVRVEYFDGIVSSGIYPYRDIDITSATIDLEKELKDRGFYFDDYDITGGFYFVSLLGWEDVVLPMTFGINSCNDDFEITLNTTYSGVLKTMLPVTTADYEVKAGDDIILSITKGVNDCILCNNQYTVSVNDESYGIPVCSATMEYVGDDEGPYYGEYTTWYHVTSPEPVPDQTYSVGNFDIRKLCRQYDKALVPGHIYKVTLSSGSHEAFKTFVIGEVETTYDYSSDFLLYRNYVYCFNSSADPNVFANDDRIYIYSPNPYYSDKPSSISVDRTFRIDVEDILGFGDHREFEIKDLDLYQIYELKVLGSLCLSDKLCPRTGFCGSQSPNRASILPLDLNGKYVPGLYRIQLANFTDYTLRHFNKVTYPQYYDSTSHTINIIPGDRYYYSEELEINNDVTIDHGEMAILASTLKIMPGKTLTVKGELQFNLYSKIIVMPGAKLIVDEGKLTNNQYNYNVYGDCIHGNEPEQMWQGVEVWGTSSESQIPTNNILHQGKVEIINGGTIENAVKGIRVFATNSQGAIEPGTTGGIVYADGANFRNNGIAVQFEPYSNFYQTPSNKRDNLSYFRNCTFETTDLFIDNTITPTAFICLNGVDGIDITGNTFINSQTGSIAANMRGIGIKSINSGYNVRPICYDDNCTLYKANIFENLFYGIYAQNSSCLYPVIIKNNEFKNNTRGVYLGGADDPVVTLNKFDIGKSEVISTSSTGSTKGLHQYLVESYGLYLGNVQSFDVQENKFFTSGTQKGSYGSLIWKSGSTGNELYNNTYHDLLIGTQTMGFNVGLQIKCNHFTSNISLTDICITSGTVGNNQGKCIPNNKFSPAGNTFSFTNNEIMANSGVTHFQYNHHNSSATEPRPAHYTAAIVTPYECTEVYSPDVCPTRLGTGSTTTQLLANITTLNNELTALYSNIDGGNTQAMLDKVNSNLSSAQLKNELLTTASLSDTVMIATLTRTQPLKPGHIKEILVPNSPLTDNVIKVLNQQTLPPGIKNEIQAVQTGESQRSVFEQQINAIEAERTLAVSELIQLYAEDTTGTGPANIIAFLETQPDKLSKQMLVQEYSSAGKCSEAQTILGQLPEISQDEKDFYTLYSILVDLCSAGSTVYDLSEEQKQTVETLALSNSIVSAYAQAIMSQVYGNWYWEKIEELTIPEEQTLRGYLYNNVSCNNLPVPNDTIILLDTSLTEIVLATPVVTDASGKFIFNYYELMSLGKDELFTFGTTNGAVEQDTVFKTIGQWIASSPVNLNLKKLEAGFVNDSNVCVTDTIHFTDKTVNGLKPYTYSWSFAHGITSTLANPEIKFISEGTYNISLAITDASGCKDTVRKQLAIQSCSSISGTLYEHADCGGAPFAGDTLVLKDNAGNIVTTVTPSITNYIGEFRFNNNEVKLLDTAKLYTLATKSGFELENVTPKTINLWIDESPLTMSLKNVNQEWFDKYIGVDSIQAIGQAIDLHGNIYVMGTQTFTGNFYKYLLLKYNPSGQLLWSKTFSGPYDYNYPVAFYVDSLCNTYITGSCRTNNYSISVFYTVKCDSNGIEQWNAVYNESINNSFNNIASSLAVDNEGNVCVTGYTWYNRFFTVKYNSAGVIQWSQVFQCLYGRTDAIKTDKNQNIIVNGIAYNSQANGYQYLTIKYDKNGILQWFKYGNTFSVASYGSSMIIDESGNIFITGSMGTVKYNSNGVFVWDQSNSMLSIAFDADSNIITCGITGIRKYDKMSGNIMLEINNINVGDLISDKENNTYAIIEGKPGSVCKYDYLGNIIWSQPFNKVSKWARGVDIVISDNENVYVAGYGSLSDIDSRGVAVTVKYSQCPSTAELRSGAVSDIGNNESDIQVINFNENTITVYPNPYSDNTLIELVLKSDADVSLEVYTMTGQCVANVYTGTAKVGTYKYEFSAKKLGYSAGTYILKATVNNEVSSYWLVEMK